MKFNSDVHAREYLKATDFYFTVDKLAQLTPERKAELETNRESARQFIRAVFGETVSVQNTES